MAKVIRSAGNLEQIDCIEELRALASGTLLVNAQGEVYMAVYVYNSIRDDEHSHGMFPMRVSSGEVDDNNCYPLFVIPFDDKVTLIQV